MIAKVKYLRIAPRKIRATIDLIRGKRVDEALAILSNLQKRSSLPVKKLIESAFSNAKQKSAELQPSQLVIAEIQANGGPVMKRWRAGAMGRAMPVLKRTSHIEVRLEQERRNSRGA